MPETGEARRERLEREHTAATIAGDDAAADRLDAELEAMETAQARAALRAEHKARVRQAHEAEQVRLADEAAREAKAQALATATAEWTRHATALAADLDAGLVRLDTCRAVLASAREVYVLHLDLTGREHRAARACPERLGEWLASKLGLPTPWPVPKARRAMGLLEFLGLDKAPSA